jgi:predicted GIY-YIG superfamily endonuclease
LDKRILEHNQLKGAYTKKYAPWKLETFIGFQDEKLAHAFERYLKSGSGFASSKRHFLVK